MSTYAAAPTTLAFSALDPEFFNAISWDDATARFTGTAHTTLPIFDRPADAVEVSTAPTPVVPLLLWLRPPPLSHF
jgi:hypothetical protein